jgi:hypothetical protein
MNVNQILIKKSMQTIRLLLIIFVLAKFSVGTSYAQLTGSSSTVKLPGKQTSVVGKTTVPQSQVWLRAYNKIQLNDKWTLHTELEVRRYIKPDRAYQTMLPRVHIHRVLGSGWEVLAGFAYFTNTQNTNNPNLTLTVNVPELRPMIGLEYKQTNKRLSINHRYWLEERFQHNYSINSTDTEAGLTNGYNFTLRARYRLQLQYDIIKKATPKGSLKLNVSEEIFLNLAKSGIINTFDQNRIFLGLDYGISNKFILQAGYYGIYQSSSSTVGTFYQRDCLRATIFYNVDMRKKESKIN